MKKLVALLLAIILCSASCIALADDAAVWELPNKSDKLHTRLLFSRASMVTILTGEYTINRTTSRFNVDGVDLGSMAEMNGKVYMFGGDTFDSVKKRTGWRSNVLFIIEDDDPSDGLTITGAITDENGHAKELLPSAKVDHAQMTVIPTNIFAVDNTLYCIYMSVKHWDEQGGVWTCGYSGLAKSTDEGQTWEMLDDVKWPGDSNFIQTANSQVGDTMYIWGIPSGRFGGVALMKCNVNELENYEAYEYFTGTDDAGNPQWVKGSDGVYQAKVIIDAPVGEISCMYNEYLGNYVMLYIREGYGVVMREGITPWGKWGKEINLNTKGYGNYMLPKYTEENGRIFYFTTSHYFPIYNIYWMKLELPKKLD